MMDSSATPPAWCSAVHSRCRYVFFWVQDLQTVARPAVTRVVLWVPRVAVPSRLVLSVLKTTGMSFSALRRACFTHQQSHDMRMSFLEPCMDIVHVPTFRMVASQASCINRPLFKQGQSWLSSCLLHLVSATLGCCSGMVRS